MVCAYTQTSQTCVFSHLKMISHNSFLGNVMCEDTNMDTSPNYVNTINVLLQHQELIKKRTKHHASVLHHHFYYKSLIPHANVLRVYSLCC